jgi:hypothetical protein
MQSKRELPPSYQDALYRTDELRMYRSNPVITALPRLYERTDLPSLLHNKPDIRAEDRDLSPRQRVQTLDLLSEWRFPFDWHLNLVREFEDLIRNGYKGRNPLDKLYWARVRAGKKLLQDRSRNGEAASNLRRRIIQSTAGIIPIIGPSGLGKTFGIYALSSLFPEVIRHRSFNGQRLRRRQVVAPIVRCPPDGNIKEFCRRFFRAMDELLGTHYEKDYVIGTRSTRDELVSGMYSVVAAHCVGAIIADEMQNLREAKEGEAQILLNYFSDFVNDLCVPIIPVGTGRAIDALTRDFRQARRMTGTDFPLHRLREQNADDWREYELFVKAMFRYQLVKNPIQVEDQHIRAMYWETQGVPDLTVKWFIATQVRAINSGDETITCDLIHTVRDRFALVQPMLDALRKHDEDALELYEDLKEMVSVKQLVEEGLKDQRPATVLEPNISVPDENEASIGNQPLSEGFTEEVSTNKTDEPLRQPVKRSRKKKLEPIVLEGGLIQILEQVKLTGRTPYELLFDGGHIWDVAKYLE